MCIQEVHYCTDEMKPPAGLKLSILYDHNYIVVIYRAISANLGNSITVLVLFCILFDR